MKIRLKLRSEEREGVLCKFLCLVVYGLFFINLFSGVQDFVGISSNIVSIAIKGIIGVAFICLLPILYRRVTSKMILFTFFSVLIILVNFLLFPKNAEYFIDTTIFFLTTCYSIFLVGNGIHDFEKLYSNLLKMSYVVALSVALLCIVVFSGLVKFNDGKYSMGFGYSCLIPVLFLLSDSVKTRNILSIIGTVIIIFGIISFGSRGPLIGIVLFVICYYYKYVIRTKRFIQGFFVLLALITVFLLRNEILMLLSSFFERFGINSRTIQLLVTNTGYITGRDKLYDVLIPIIKENPFAVRGINAEYQLLGVYAHNIVIELLYQLGFIFAFPILLLIVYNAIKTIVKNDITDKNTILLILLFGSLPQLMVSSSLWISYPFWLWVAILSNKSAGLPRRQ